MNETPISTQQAGSLEKKLSGTRYDELSLKVKVFHNSHPEVWDLFRKFTFDLIAKGFKHYGAKSVFERIRWHTDTPDSEGKSSFKVNNDYTAFYARAFMKRYPKYDGFFRIRQQTSKNRDAVEMFELTPDDFPYTSTREESGKKESIGTRIKKSIIKLITHGTEPKDPFE